MAQQQTPTPDSRNSTTDRTTTSATKARQGEASGRVSAVLVISLGLAIIAAVAILAYFYTTRSPAAF